MDCVWCSGDGDGLSFPVHNVVDVDDYDSLLGQRQRSTEDTSVNGNGMSQLH